jgi:hypothetical protein
VFASEITGASVTAASTLIRSGDELHNVTLMFRDGGPPVYAPPAAWRAPRSGCDARQGLARRSKHPP